MKLSLLHESWPNGLLNSTGVKLFFIKSAARNGEKKKLYPTRSGTQDTPLKPRHRKYFNAPLGAVQGKVGHGIPLGGEMGRMGWLQKRGVAAV